MVRNEQKLSADLCFDFWCKFDRDRRSVYDAEKVLLHNVFCSRITTIEHIWAYRIDRCKIYKAVISNCIKPTNELKLAYRVLVENMIWDQFDQDKLVEMIDYWDIHDMLANNIDHRVLSHVSAKSKLGQLIVEHTEQNWVLEAMCKEFL